MPADQRSDDGPGPAPAQAPADTGRAHIGRVVGCCQRIEARLPADDAPAGDKDDHDQHGHDRQGVRRAHQRDRQRRDDETARQHRRESPTRDQPGETEGADDAANLQDRGDDSRGRRIEAGIGQDRRQKPGQKIQIEQVGEVDEPVEQRDRRPALGQKILDRNALAALLGRDVFGFRPDLDGRMHSPDPGRDFFSFAPDDEEFERLR